MRVGFRIAVLALVAAAAVLVTAGAAQANVALSVSLSWPSGAGVGAQAVPASFTIQNTNTPPQQADTLKVTLLRLAPSCASVRSGTTVCPSPDPGVYSLSPTAVGQAGTACAGITFAVSAPDASGTVTLTPGTAVVLQPPGGPVGTDRCTVNLLVNVTKVPSTDVDPAAGVQTWTNLYVEATSSPSNLSPSVGPSLETTVNPGVPGLSTSASVVGSTVSDTATLTAAGNGPVPTGTVTFNVYGPNDATCSGTAQTSIQVLASGHATAAFPVSGAGAYRFKVSYSGDANYMSRIGQCNDPGESVTVVARSRPSDFDGDGKSDVAVFRPSTGTWYVSLSGGGSPVVPWGASGDVPVAGDYNGDGKSDVAVFRPSTGTWYISLSGGGSTASSWGSAGDIPVPADFNGDGKSDVAVFRPSTGTWYLQLSGAGTSASIWGASGDIPVAADYDGDGKADLAVFRPSTGTWYIQLSGGGTTATRWGVSGDVPVVGDYNGDGKADLAVFRPSTGTWYVSLSGGGSLVMNWGASGDKPIGQPPGT
ncbi:MAG: hypothetical protein QOG44_2184 [Acidimicrobiaceae bacterium]|nr:hypothetical protein [Acidimicrobiaceae bacterium]